jgi:hypothetical protein
MVRSDTGGERVMRKQLVIIGIVVLLASVGLTLFTYNPFNTERNKFV